MIFFGLDYKLQADEQKKQRQKNKPEIKIYSYKARAFQQGRQAKGDKKKTEYYAYHNFYLPAVAFIGAKEGLKLN